MEPTPEKANNRSHAKKLRLFLALVAVAALLTTAYWLFFLQHRVTTDNAYVMANSARLSSRVSGAISRILVENDQPVEVGQVLVELDTGDFQAIVDQTRGVFNKIEAEISGAAISIDPTDIQKAAQIKAAEASLQEAQAALEAAQLNLSYCQVKAPIAGYIAQKNIQIGDWIQPGQPLMAVVPLQDVYVEANFKEIHLKHVRLGQPVTIKADVYPDYTYHGRVVGIRAGTGASFSLLPPENATGNWIKVVQRVPVKIEFDEPPPADHPLRVGFSLHVSISTKNKSGNMLVPPASKP